MHTVCPPARPPARPPGLPPCRNPDGSRQQLGAGQYGAVYRMLLDGIQPLAAKVGGPGAARSLPAAAFLLGSQPAALPQPPEKRGGKGAARQGGEGKGMRADMSPRVEERPSCENTVFTEFTE